MIHEAPTTAATRTPRARRHETNLGRILDAAAELIARVGLDGLSMSALADAVDYTPGALYRYVDSKDALLAQLVQRILADAHATLAAAVAALPPRASPLARVIALVHAYRGFARREPHRFGLLATTMAEPRVLLADPGHAQATATAVVLALRPLADALGGAAEAGLITAGDPVERTLCLFALLHGLLQLPKLGRVAPEVIDVDRLTVAGTRALLIGWGASPRNVDAAITRAVAA